MFGGKARLLTLASLIFVSSVSFAQTSQHVMSHAKARNGAVQSKLDSGEQQAFTKKLGTDEAPLIVKIKNARPEVEAERDADYQERKATDDRVIMFGWAEMVIGAISAIIIAFQTGALIFTLRATNRSIGLNEKHFAETEYPYVAIENVRPIHGLSLAKLEDIMSDSDEISLPFEVTYDVVNYGKNPAIVIEHYMAVFIGEKLPEFPAPNVNDIFTNEFVVGANQRRAGFRNAFYRGKITKETVMALTFAHVIDEPDKRTRAYAFGMVRYKAIGGHIETVGGIWEYSVNSNRFFDIENKNYNYRLRQSANFKN